MGKIQINGSEVWAIGATDNEVLLGGRDDVAVTPKSLCALASSSAIAVTGTNTTQFVTPAALRAVIQKLKVLSFTGKNNAGACTLTGAAVGDLVLGVAGITTVGGLASSFESVITVVNQIQQSSTSDLSTKAYTVVLLAVA
jgi:hypothetical protein